jgi:uncharacterized protein (TIGR02145 family)
MVGGSLIYFSIARQKARDTQRVSDIRSLAGALELYYRDEGRYPEFLNFGESLIGSNTNIVYLETIPSNPRPYADGTCSDNEYGYGTNLTGSSYMIDFCLGGRISDYGPGTIHSEPTGLSNFYCGTSTVFYDGGPWNSTGVIRSNSHYYRTVQIGAQCWLADSLNVGTMVNSVDVQTNNGIVEKYCYDNDLVKCSSYGGLYQWTEGMEYSTLEGAKGICPNGWHIPTDAEQHILDLYLTDSGQTCDAGRTSDFGCDTAGTKLKQGGASGFEGLLVGYRNTDGTFIFQGTYDSFWSSSIFDTYTWYRNLGSLSAGVKRYADAQDHGYSIRCLKNTQIK